MKYFRADPEAYGEGEEFEADNDDAAVEKVRADLINILGDHVDGERYELYRHVPNADLADYAPDEKDVGERFYELYGRYIVIDQSRVFESIIEGVVRCKSADTLRWEAEEAEREQEEWDARQTEEACQPAYW